MQLNGVLDNLRAERLAKRIREYLEKDHGKLILDLENVRASEGKALDTLANKLAASGRQHFSFNKIVPNPLNGSLRLVRQPRPGRALQSILCLFLLLAHLSNFSAICSIDSIVLGGNAITALF